MPSVQHARSTGNKLFSGILPQASWTMALFMVLSRSVIATWHLDCFRVARLQNEIVQKSA